jgi:hypothetical protein
MAHTYAVRLTHGASPARSSIDSPDEVARERQSLRARANLALVTLWAGLAVAIAVYAIDRESVGAGVLAVFVVAQLLAPWLAAFRSEDEEPVQRPIAFGE